MGPRLQGTARRWDGLEGAQAHPWGVGSWQTARAVPARLGSAEKGKPGVTRGRKATGLGLRDRRPLESAGLPDWRLVWLRPARASTRSCASSPLWRSQLRASHRYARSDANDASPTDAPSTGRGVFVSGAAGGAGAETLEAPASVSSGPPTSGAAAKPPTVATAGAAATGVIRSPGERCSQSRADRSLNCAPGAPNHAGAARRGLRCKPGEHWTPSVVSNAPRASV